MPKYKYAIATYIRDFIEGQLLYFKENKRQLEIKKDEMIPSQISQYGPRTGGGFNTEQRPTEDIVIKRNPEYLMEQERIVNVIDSVYNHLSNQDKELIRLKYWDGKLTPDGIAMKLGIDKTTMYYRLNNIIVEIARRLGYIDI